MFPPQRLDHAALFLDFDGTLVDIAPHPEAVTIAPGMPNLIERLLVQSGGALAVVSGRLIAEIDRFLFPVRTPASGLHGLELREEEKGKTLRLAAAPSLESLRKSLSGPPFDSPGVIIEDKELSIALHYRQAPEAEAAVVRAVAALAAPFGDLEILRGKMVAEVKPTAGSKAVAVRHFIGTVPAFSGRYPIFVGDDVTDEDGIRMAAACGGFGVKVGAGASLAHYRLPSPQAVRSWLERVAAG